MRPASALPAASLPFERWAGLAARLSELAFVALPLLFLLGRALADVAVSLIALAFLARSAMHRDWSWTEHAWVRIALGLWLYLVIANALAEDPARGLGHAAVYLRLILLAVAMEHWLLRDRDRRSSFVIVLAGVVGFVAVDCVIQFFGGVSVTGQTPPETYRLTGPFGGQKPGTYLAKTGYLVLAGVTVWAVLRGWPARAALLALLAALVGVVLLTGERSALIGLLAGGAVLLAMVRELRPLILVAALGLSVGGGTLVSQKPVLLERIVQHTRDDMVGFEDKRYGQIARTAIALWAESPIVGIGLKHYRVRCADPSLESIGPIEARCYPHPHHVYLEWLTETGLVGLAGFLALIGAWAIRIGRAARAADPATRALSACAAAALIVFLWPLATSMSLFVTWNGILFWQAVGWAMAVTRS